MEPVSLITTTLGVLTQVGLALKGARSLLDNYGDDALRIGKSVFGFVKNRFEGNEETRGEIDYFAVNPEQEKRQQTIANSLDGLIQQDDAFRKGLENLLTEYQQAVSQEAMEETRTSVKVEVKIGGNVSHSNVYTSGRDITMGRES